MNSPFKWNDSVRESASRLPVCCSKISSAKAKFPLPYKNVLVHCYNFDKKRGLFLLLFLQDLGQWW